jgi:hypothetical protein
MAGDFDLATRYAKSSKIVSREICGEAILVPISRKPTEVESIFVLNETGSAIWELLDGTRTVEQVLEAITEEFDVERQTAQLDAVELMRELLEIGAVVEA